jgi:hypothetical protein
VKGHSKIQQRSVVAYLSAKGISARDIHDDLETILGPVP